MCYILKRLHWQQGHVLGMSNLLCGYPTAYDVPCQNPVQTTSTHCAAGHPCVPAGGVVDTSRTNGAIPVSSDALDAEEVLGHTPATPKPNRYIRHGSRYAVDSLGVDAGCMAVGPGLGWKEDLANNWDLGDDHAYPRGHFVTATASGDGVYDLLEIRDPETNEVVGAEAVFDLTTEIDEYRREHPEQFLIEVEDFDEDGNVIGSHEEENVVSDWDLYESALDSSNPAGAPVYKASFELEKGTKMSWGDPCYDGPSAYVEGKPGTWDVFVYEADGTPQRLAAYLRR